MSVVLDSRRPSQTTLLRGQNGSLNNFFVSGLKKNLVNSQKEANLLSQKVIFLLKGFSTKLFK